MARRSRRGRRGYAGRRRSFKRRRRATIARGGMRM